MVGFTLQRDKNGVVQNYEQQVLEQVADFEILPHWPHDQEECRKFLWDFALCAGVLVGMGEISMEQAYGHTRIMCKSLQDESWGQLRVSDLFPGCIFTIDSAAQRFDLYFRMGDHRARQRLKKCAIATILANGTMDSVRAALAADARQIVPNPPVQVLQEALHEAIGECRRNAQWLTNRGTKA